MLNVEGLLKMFGPQFVENLRIKLQQDDTFVTGTLANSLFHQVSGNTLSIYGVNYASAIDTGTKDYGKPPSPVAIEQWIEERGITSTRVKPERLAFAISQSISRNGTIQRFKNQGGGTNYFDVVLQHMQPKLKEELAKIVDDYTIQITKPLRDA